MSSRTAIAALALVACAPEDAGPVSACPLDAPVRLAAPPDGWRPQPALLIFQTLGDHILYRFDPSVPEYWLVHRCGGEPQRFSSATPGLRHFRGLHTADGIVVYARDDAGRHHVVDRLDVPGFDDPRPVPGLPDEALTAWPTEFGLYLETPRDPENLLGGAAGIGADIRSVYIHHGDAAAPAVKLADRAVRTEWLGDRLLVHDDDGSLREVDPRTGASELVLAGVRHFSLAAAARRLIWQQLGDDLAEPIFLRDLDTGVDIPIAVNDFTDVSWNRPGDPETSGTGAWVFTGDGAHAALLGPGHAPAAAVRTDTGAPVSLPTGVRVRGGLDHEFDLVVADDDDDHVRAVWDPATGDLCEWFRGPLADHGPAIFDRADDRLDYLLSDVTGYSATLWRVDLTTGEATVQVPRVAGIGAFVLDDGRYLTEIPSPDFYPIDLVVFDPDTGKYTTIAAAVENFAYYRDQGLVYLDTRSAAPGLWAAPIPPR